MIRAAGGIVVQGDDVLLVHRPKYDDWSLPKGKCKRGESDEACALREIEEETGLTCEVVRTLGESRYQVPSGEKIVQWFLMRPLHGEFEPHEEIDALAWVARANVPDRLTFEIGAEQLEQLDTIDP